MSSHRALTSDQCSLASINRVVSIVDVLEGSVRLSLAELARATCLSETITLRYATSLVTHGLL